MPVIKPTSLRDLKLRVNIVDVVGRVATLRKARSPDKRLCPFDFQATYIDVIILNARKHQPQSFWVHH